MKRKQEMTLTLARRVVLDAVKNPAKSGFALATPPLTRRYDWLARMFVPALRLLGRPGTKVSRGLMAHGYFLLGDILSVQLGAHHASIKAYRVAARWQPRSARIWSEIGLEYSALDNLQEALRAYGKAKRYATNEDDRKEFADDIVRLEERAEARGHRKRRGIYLFPDDLAFESIAEFKPMRALEILQRPRTVEALMARAAADRGRWLPRGAPESECRCARPTLQWPRVAHRALRFKIYASMEAGSIPAASLSPSFRIHG